ncbi:hypothetical protein HBI24_179040 [Parastagonospora nodorum]|nr:hypothetical protein HBH53_187420 [Parastagonospora nodorum]KAH4046083.1 hypothetical protein HBH49_193150 [Parastagonospora nodorum]KAH4060254.1 hypothetical protein HBH50_224190 [Parastagonospora nodorum]KAH4132043.1 hypothetical protein HBH45_187090 [Parastagonospora nodorum]KAH4150015.1 hypothetical protein HBH44_187790 [Parastagonospora nodorum]
MLLRWNMDHLDLPGASEALRARTLFATGVGTLRCVGAAAVARSHGVFGRCLRVEAAEVLELLENSSSGSVHWTSIVDSSSLQTMTSCFWYVWAGGVDGQETVLFVRDDARDDSQEWYTEWREVTGDCLLVFDGGIFGLLELGK